jgi:hypothetical protein
MRPSEALGSGIIVRSPSVRSPGALKAVSATPISRNTCGFGPGWGARGGRGGGVGWAPGPGAANCKCTRPRCTQGAEAARCPLCQRPPPPQPTVCVIVRSGSPPASAAAARAGRAAPPAAAAAAASAPSAARRLAGARCCRAPAGSAPESACGGRRCCCGCGAALPGWAARAARAASARAAPPQLRAGPARPAAQRIAL